MNIINSFQSKIWRISRISSRLIKRRPENGANKEKRPKDRETSDEMKSPIKGPPQLSTSWQTAGILERRYIESLETYKKTPKIDNTKLSIVGAGELDYLYIYRTKLPTDVYISRKNGSKITKDQTRENNKRGQMLHLT